MVILNIDTEDRFQAISASIIRDFGITLTLGHDFEEYREYSMQARPDHPLGKPFDPKLTNLHQKKAVWVVGRDEEDTIVHLQALSLLPTGNCNLAEYFSRRFRDFFPVEMDVDFDRARYRPGPGAQRIAGRVAYSGETWIGGDRGQYRGTNLSNILGRFALFTALRKLNADHVVGFMARPVAYKGFCLRMGFMHAEPMALRWYVKDNPEMLEGVMVYMSREDIRFALDLPTQEIEVLAA